MERTVGLHKYITADVYGSQFSLYLSPHACDTCKQMLMLYLKRIRGIRDHQGETVSDIPLRWDFKYCLSCGKPLKIIEEPEFKEDD